MAFYNDGLILKRITVGIGGKNDFLAGATDALRTLFVFCRYVGVGSVLYLELRPHLVVLLSVEQLSLASLTAVRLLLLIRELLPHLEALRSDVVPRALRLYPFLNMDN